MVGFTFCGRHSYRDFGIIMHSKERPLLPERRRRELELPQKDGRYMFDGTTYDVRVISVECYVHQADLPKFRAHIRRVAQWLADSGALIFDDEPDKRYEARVFSSVPLEQLLSAGIFTVVFDCQPFAAGRKVQKNAFITQNQQRMEIRNMGTVSSPCRIVLANNGPNTVSHITISVLRDGKDD